jgi:hypothetical protein
MVDPIAFGAGRSIFGGVTRRLELKLATTHALPNGCVVLSYRPR